MLALVLILISRMKLLSTYPFHRAANDFQLFYLHPCSRRYSTPSWLESSSAMCYAKLFKVFFLFVFRLVENILSLFWCFRLSGTMSWRCFIFAWVRLLFRIILLESLFFRYLYCITTSLWISIFYRHTPLSVVQFFWRVWTSSWGRLIH